MSIEGLAIGQKMIYTFWNTRKQCTEENEVEVIWIYNDTYVEVKILNKVYKVELVKCADLRVPRTQREAASL